jgi:outer membrane protein TolC
MLISALFLFLFPQTVPATEIESPARLTLDACVQEALKRNPASDAAKYAEQSAMEEVGAVKGKYYPEVSFRTGYRRWESHAFLPEGFLRPGLDTIGPVNEWRANLRSQYTLFDSGLRSSELKAAQSQHSATTEESLRVRNDIIYRVHSAYYELLAAEAEVELAKQSQSRSQDHLRLAAERKAAGAVPQSDVTRARVDASTADLRLVSAESAVRIARGNLNEVMGRAAFEPLEVAGAEQTAPDPAGTNIEQAVLQALEKRPEVQAALKRLEAKQNQIGAVRSEILPKVRAEAGYGWLDETFLPEDSDWWVGITLDVPLFDGGTRRSRIARSKIEVSREQAQVDQLKLSVQQEVWSAYSRWIEGFQSLQTNFVRKEEAEESLRLTRARYEEGADTINDLLDAELALDQAETGLNGSRYRLYVAKAGFLLAAGEL